MVNIIRHVTMAHASRGNTWSVIRERESDARRAEECRAAVISLSWEDIVSSARAMKMQHRVCA